MGLTVIPFILIGYHNGRSLMVRGMLVPSWDSPVLYTEAEQGGQAEGVPLFRMLLIIWCCCTYEQVAKLYRHSLSREIDIIIPQVSSHNFMFSKN